MVLLLLLLHFLDHGKKMFRREACWAFSNIFASTESHIGRVFTYKDATIVKKLFELLKTEEDMEVVVEHIFIKVCFR